MNIKTILTILKNILYTCFFIGVFFLIVAALLYLPCKCYVANSYQTYFGISSVNYNNFWVGFVGLIKVILIFLFLVPALAIHLTTYIYKKKHPFE